MHFLLSTGGLRTFYYQPAGYALFIINRWVTHFGLRTFLLSTGGYVFLLLTGGFARFYYQRWDQLTFTELTFT